jgi:hypothetical protein
MVVLMSARRALVIQWTLMIIVALGLGVDAYVHFHLASAFASVKTGTLSQADLFHVEATVSVIAAAAVLVRPRRYTAAFACLVAASGTVAVLLYRYVDVGAFGPIPNMYDPYWAPTEKALSAVAEGAAALAALALFMLLQVQAPRRTRSGRADPRLDN